MAILNVLRRPVYLGATIVLAAFLSWLYLNLSLRADGMDTTIFTTSLATPEFGIDTFGAAYYYGGAVLDLVAALLTAVLLVFTFANYRARQSGVALGGSIGSTASVAVAVAAFS